MSILQVVEFLQHLEIMRIKARPGRSLLLLVSWVLLEITPASGQTLDRAMLEYREGRPDQAASVLDSLDKQSENNPEELLLLARTELLGEQSESYLREVLTQGNDDEARAEARLLMCQYEFCRGRYLAASEAAEAWDRRPGGVGAYAEALWISGSSFLAAQESDSAQVRFRRILADFPESPWAVWAQLSLGDCLLEAGDYEHAILSYKRVLDYHRSSEAFPFALSGLADCYANSGDQEEALLYHNLLEERFPQNVESFEAALPGNAPRTPEEQGKAERLAGVTYTIQLGVFGVRENALGLKMRLEQQGYRARIQAKTISGKTYQVVQLGSFDSYQEALDLKKKLEAQTGEAYRVVIR
jgi:tetratricopeptide (TPR) repeat protein